MGTLPLPVVLIGMVVVEIGTFFAAGFVGRAATSDLGSARALYLACCFLGGLVGSVVLGQVFDQGMQRSLRVALTLIPDSAKLKFWPEGATGIS